jgi:hypothetical protein
MYQQYNKRHTHNRKLTKQLKDVLGEEEKHYDQ